MNIVIAGAGAVGTHLAKMLSRQEHNIMLIDTNQDKLEDLESQIDILSIVGSCTSIGALKDAEVGKCDLYIAVNPQEDQNINSAILAKKLGAKRTIARVNNSEYLEIENAEYLRSIGIDSLIYPERLAAEEIVASLKQIGSRQMHEFSDGRLQLLGIKLWDNALILNHTLIKMAEIYGADQFRIVAIKRHNHTIIPRGNDELKYGDLVFIVTRPSFISNVFALCGKEQFEIKNIVKSYGDLKVLKGIDLTIAEKEIVTIVGASGAGKSTFLHILGTLDSPDEGEIYYDSINVAQLNPNKLSVFRNSNIGFVFQFHHLLPEFSALENVCIPAWIKGTGKKEAEKRALELLTMLGLKDRITHKPNQLSGGEQQRVSVARALVNHPRVVLADEPSGNLDTRTKNELHQLFFTLREELGQTFVIVTHDNELARMSDRQIKLNDGMI